MLLEGRALDYKKSISDFVSKNREFCPWELSDEDWKAIELVEDWLCCYREATVSMSATKHATLLSTHAIFKGVQDSLRTSMRAILCGSPPQLLNGLKAAHLKLADYFTKFDASPLYVWSCCECFVLPDDECLLTTSDFQYWILASHIQV